MLRRDLLLCLLALLFGFCMASCAQEQQAAREGLLERTVTEHLVAPIDSSALPMEGHFWVSPDGQRVAYFVSTGTGWAAVVDGQRGQEYERCDWTREDGKMAENVLAFSPDSQHVAYVAQKGGQQFVVVDDQEGKHYRWVAPFVRFSPGAQWVIYWANASPNEYYLVIDGEEIGPYSGVGHGPVFSPNGRRMAYAASRHGWSGLIVDGQELRHYDLIGGLVFSPDGRHLAYYACDYERHEGGLVMVLDGEESKPYSGLTGPVFSADGWRLAYRAQSREGTTISSWFTVVDGQEWKQYATEGPFLFSPDSKQLAYVARKGDQRTIVVDGKAGQRYDRIIGWPTFSDDSQRLAYGAEVEGKQFVVVNGRGGKRYDRIVANSLAFGPDSRWLAYGAVAGGEEFVVLGESEGRPYDALIVDQATGKVRVVFDSPTSFHYLARRGNEILLVQETIRSGPPVSAARPEPSLPLYGQLSCVAYLLPTNGPLPRATFVIWRDQVATGGSPFTFYSIEPLSITKDSIDGGSSTSQT